MEQKAPHDEEMDYDVYTVSDRLRRILTLPGAADKTWISKIRTRSHTQFSEQKQGIAALAILPEA